MRKFAIISVFILILCVILDAIHIKTSHKLEVKEYIPIEIEYSFQRDFSKQEVRKSVTKLFDTSHFCFELDTAGDEKTSIPLRIVLISPDVDKRLYAYVLAHGLTHIKYRTADETWVSFMAFKTLYESNDDILKASALYYAEKVMWGWYGDKYNIGYYIIEYLKTQ